MDFQEDVSIHTQDDLIWFGLTADPPGQFGIDYIFGLSMPRGLQSLRYGIKKGFLSLFFFQARLPKHTWRLTPPFTFKGPLEAVPLEMCGTEIWSNLIFTASPDSLLQGRGQEMLGDVEILGAEACIYATFTVNRDGYQIILGEKILDSSASQFVHQVYLPNLRRKFPNHPDLIAEQLETQTGVLSYVKLRASFRGNARELC